MRHLLNLLTPGVLIFWPGFWAHLVIHCPWLLAFSMYAFRPGSPSKWALLILAGIVDSLALGLVESVQAVMRYRYLNWRARVRRTSRRGRELAEGLIRQHETLIRTAITHLERPPLREDARFRMLCEFLAACAGPMLEGGHRNAHRRALVFVVRNGYRTSSRLTFHASVARNCSFACAIPFLAPADPQGLGLCLALLALCLGIRFGWKASPLHLYRVRQLEVADATRLTAGCDTSASARSAQRRETGRETSSASPGLLAANLVCTAALVLALPPPEKQTVQRMAAAAGVLAAVHFAGVLPYAAWCRRRALRQAAG